MTDNESGFVHYLIFLLTTYNSFHLAFLQHCLANTVSCRDMLGPDSGSDVLESAIESFPKIFYFISVFLVFLLSLFASSLYFGFVSCFKQFLYFSELNKHKTLYSYVFM